MSTCADCEWWKAGLRYPRDGADEAHLTQTGMCDNEEAFPFPRYLNHKRAHVSTWHDFPACMYFKPRQDWAEKAAELISKLSSTWDTFRKSAAEIIREEAAKAGVK